ncbi:MAG: hypothetical protein ABIQ98_02045, partial [Sphingomicrobium sp.]
MADADEQTEHWHEFDGCERIALRRGHPFARNLGRILCETPHDLLVSNSFFDRQLTLPTLLMRRAGVLRSPLLLAPRGEFSPGALEIKSLRKRTYIRFARSFG